MELEGLEAWIRAKVHFNIVLSLKSCQKDLSNVTDYKWTESVRNLVQSVNTHTRQSTSLHNGLITCQTKRPQFTRHKSNSNSSSSASKCMNQLLYVYIYTVVCRQQGRAQPVTIWINLSWVKDLAASWSKHKCAIQELENNEIKYRRQNQKQNIIHTTFEHLNGNLCCSQINNLTVFFLCVAVDRSAVQRRSIKTSRIPTSQKYTVFHSW